MIADLPNLSPDRNLTLAHLAREYESEFPLRVEWITRLDAGDRCLEAQAFWGSKLDRISDLQFEVAVGERAVADDNNPTLSKVEQLLDVK
ncbi:hypothetical protein AB1L88_20450 [Tautonia sp. JC769]|uniref:hypothetical protein n=1 Tax=Tautonia sp. JC769 TaxID=3232135 RepID=UPI003459A79E